MRPARLGVVTTSYPRHPGDPAGSFVAGHVAALRALGHAVDVIAAGAPSVDVHRIGGGRLFYTGGAPDQLERTPRAIIDAIAFATRLTHAVITRAHAWDAIVAHWLAPSALAALPARLPLLAIAHGGDIHTLRRLHLLAPALHLLHRRRARLAFVSDELRAIACASVRGAARRWLADALVQPMGLDLARFAALRPARTTPPTILVVARLVPIKGVDVAIDAIAHTQRPIRLVLVGDGPERAALVARALATGQRLGPVIVEGATLRIGSSTITFRGEVDTTERDRLLGTASLVVIPSRALPSGRTEGTPLIALEALAANVPVLAAAVGGLGELAGLTLVAPERPDLLGAAIDAAHDQPVRDLRLHVAGFDWSVVAPRLVPGSRGRSVR